nr:S9 family peptidase [Bacteroidota bacterium]
MKNITFTVTLLVLCSALFAQKQPLDHSIYESWKIIKNPQISNDGRWTSYEVNPHKGDGWLYIYDLKNSRYDSVQRGYEAKFSADSKFLAFKIKPQEDTTRKAKLAKKKKDELPKDSLGIWVLEKDDIQKIARVKSFKLAQEGADWLAYHLEKPLKVKDTTDKKDTIPDKGDKKYKKKEKKGEGTELVIKKIIEGKSYSYKDVTDYNVSKNGDLFAFVRQTGDSIDSTRVQRFSIKEETDRLIFEREGTSKQIGIDNQGRQLAFVYSVDTAKIKNYDLGYWKEGLDQASIVIDSINQGIPAGWRVSEHRTPDFSESGERLFFGTAPEIPAQPKDTLLDEEKVKVDIWNWKDPLIQPHQLIELKKEEKRNYLAVFYPEDQKTIQLANEDIPDVRTFNKGNTDVALGYSKKPYSQEISWDDSYKDYYSINMNTGETNLLLKKKQSYASLSPGGKYLLWYEAPDSSWYVKNTSTLQEVALTKNLPYNFYYELNDMPQLPGSYGLAGWTEHDEAVLIYDKYDIWKFDPEGKEDPVKITHGNGREHETRYRYVKLDPEVEYLPNTMLLSAFNYDNKQSGYFSTKMGSRKPPEKLIMGSFQFTTIKKAKDEDRLIWQESSFKQYPDLWWGNIGFDVPIQITILDSQRAGYLWGDVQMVRWTSSDGEELDGLLYTPENLDKDKEYPMLVYFYERRSDNLNNFYHVSPSRSIINPAYCTSNGYVVFIPDIPYLVGYPGESALRSVVSGSLAMADQFSFIDKKNMGIQGQSWGGYQVAYLVTQTNLFKAAMAGAPVSNMTSAYGGIRWGSGMSRMFQYEKSQSRIGGTLWEKPLRYIENSPLFYADKVETPLLIMHNDEDGAVPWYQGIELFVALRRLHKPAWMLTYNGDKHNLTKWPNRVDLSIRMYQFFDHYLKGAPEPVWMKEGVPAVDKGKKFGYELVE